MRRLPTILTIAALATALTGCGGGPDLPDVTGQDLAFTRGAMAAADVEDYEVSEVEVTNPEEDGVVLAAYVNDDGVVVVEVGALPTITITGTFTLVDDPRLDTSSRGQSCSGSGGYDDFGNGMNVTVRDGSGTILASTNTTDSEWVTVSGVGGLWCRTSFETTADIVDFYTITVGSRGELSYSFDELKADDFHVELSLG